MILQRKKEAASCSVNGAVAASFKLSSNYISDTVCFTDPIQVSHNILEEPPVSITQQGETTIIKVVREISVVVKNYEVVEEIHITRHLTNTPLTHEITLRKENVHIDRIRND